MRSLSCAVLAAVVLSAAGCTSSAPPASPSLGEFKIGVLAPRSGANRAAGTEAQRGAELAAELINGEQGPAALVGTGGLARLGGAKLTIVGADTQGDPDRAASEAVRLVGDGHVAGLVGAYDAEATKVASQRTERLRIPFVNGDATADFLTQRGLDWFFRTGPTDRMLGEAFFSALGQLGGTGQRIAVLYSNDKSGTVIADLTEELATEGGFPQVTRVPFQPDGDVVGAVRRVQTASEQPDAVFLVASDAGNATRLLEAFRQLRYTPDGIFAFGPGFTQTGALVAGTDAEGLFSSTAWSREVAGRNPVAKPVMEMYEDRFGAPMGDVAAGSFTAVLVLADAIGRAGSTDPERVRSALLNLDIPGREMIMPWSGVRFDNSHQNTAAAGVIEQRVKGLFRVVFPDELQPEDAAVWPLSRLRKG